VSDKDDWRSSAFIGLGLAGLGIGGGLAAASGTMGSAAIAVWGIVFVMVTSVVRSPAAKAFVEKLREPTDATGALANEVYAELDELRNRVLELEERQDFSERMLAGGQGDDARPAP
jgi:hypothetical protein